MRVVVKVLEEEKGGPQDTPHVSGTQQAHGHGWCGGDGGFASPGIYLCSLTSHRTSTDQISTSAPLEELSGPWLFP